MNKDDKFAFSKYKSPLSKKESKAKEKLSSFTNSSQDYKWEVSSLESNSNAKSFSPYLDENDYSGEHFNFSVSNQRKNSMRRIKFNFDSISENRTDNKTHSEVSTHLSNIDRSSILRPPKSDENSKDSNRSVRPDNNKYKSILGPQKSDENSKDSNRSLRHVKSYLNSIPFDNASVKNFKESQSLKLEELKKRRDTPWTYDKIELFENNPIKNPTPESNRQMMSYKYSTPNHHTPNESSHEKYISTYTAKPEFINSGKLHDESNSSPNMSRRRSSIQPEYTDHIPVGKDYFFKSMIRVGNGNEIDKTTKSAEKERFERDSQASSDSKDKSGRHSKSRKESSRKKSSSRSIDKSLMTFTVLDDIPKSAHDCSVEVEKSLKKEKKSFIKKAKEAFSIKSDDSSSPPNSRSIKYTLIPQKEGNTLLVRDNSIPPADKVRPSLVKMFEQDKNSVSRRNKKSLTSPKISEASENIRQTLKDMFVGNKANDLPSEISKVTIKLNSRDLSLNDDLKHKSQSSKSNKISAQNVAIIDVEGNSQSDLSNSIFDRSSSISKLPHKTKIVFNDDDVHPDQHEAVVKFDTEFEIDPEPDLHLKIDIPSEGDTKKEKMENALETYDSEVMLHLIQQLLYSSACDKEYLFLDFYITPFNFEYDVFISFRTNSAIRQRVTGNPKGLVDLRDRRVYSIEEKTGVIILLDESVFYNVSGTLCNRVRLCHTYHCQNQRCLIMIEQTLPDSMKKSIWRNDSVDIVHPFRIIGPYRNFIKKYRRRLKLPNKYYSQPGHYLPTMGTLMSIRDYQLMIENRKIDKEFEIYEESKKRQ